MRKKTYATTLYETLDGDAENSGGLTVGALVERLRRFPPETPVCVQVQQRVQHGPEEHDADYESVSAALVDLDWDGPDYEGAALYLGGYLPEVDDDGDLFEIAGAAEVPEGDANV